MLLRNKTYKPNQRKKNLIPTEIIENFIRLEIDKNYKKNHLIEN